VARRMMLIQLTVMIVVFCIGAAIVNVQPRWAALLVGVVASGTATFLGQQAGRRVRGSSCTTETIAAVSSWPMDVTTSEPPKR
jgi:hypothetical protein